MRILHIITSLDVGGAQRLLVDLLPVQMREHLVGLLVLKNIPNDFQRTLMDAGIRIISTGASNFYTPSVIFQIRKFLKDWDIIHVHLFPTLYWVALASIGLRKKLVYTEHSTHNKRRNKPYFRYIERIIYSRYNKIISISARTQQNLLEWLRWHKSERFITIENGVNLRLFAKECYEKTNKIVMISRFEEMKDQETLIKAMTYVSSAYSLVLVGDGSTRPRCEKLAKDLGVANRIKFLGTRSDIADIIAKAFIGVQSSKWEGFGLTAVEFMAAGKPIIASGVDGLKQVVEGAGEIFPVGDYQNLADCINSLIENPKKYQQVSERCRQRAQLYSIENMSRRYNNVYNNLIKC